MQANGSKIKVPDRLVIAHEFVFEALTTVKQEKPGNFYLKFEFVNIDLPEIQILGSLFGEGQSVNVSSALLEKRQCPTSAMIITSIRLNKKGISWECLCAEPITSSPSALD